MRGVFVVLVSARASRWGEGGGVIDAHGKSVGGTWRYRSVVERSVCPDKRNGPRLRIDSSPNGLVSGWGWTIPVGRYRGVRPRGAWCGPLRDDVADDCAICTTLGYRDTVRAWAAADPAEPITNFSLVGQGASVGLWAAHAGVGASLVLRRSRLVHASVTTTRGARARARIDPAICCALGW